MSTAYTLGETRTPDTLLRTENLQSLVPQAFRADSSDLFARKFQNKRVLMQFFGGIPLIRNPFRRLQNEY